MDVVLAVDRSISPSIGPTWQSARALAIAGGDRCKKEIKKPKKETKNEKKEETFARWVCWRAWLAVFPISRPERGRGQGAWLPGCRLPRHWFLFLCVFNNELLWKSNIFWPAIVEAWGEWWRCATFIVGPSKRWGKGEKGTKKKWNRFLDCFFFLFFFFLSYRYLKARASTFRRGRASPGPCCWPKWRNEWWRRWWHPGTLPVDPDSFENIKKKITNKIWWKPEQFYAYRLSLKQFLSSWGNRGFMKHVNHTWGNLPPGGNLPQDWETPPQWVNSTTKPILG